MTWEETIAKYGEYETWPKWRVYAHINPKYGDYDTYVTVKACNKTMARQIAKGELNPCKIIKIVPAPNY